MEENREQPKTITDLLDEISADICENYCRFWHEANDNKAKNLEALRKKCATCPLNTKL